MADKLVEHVLIHDPATDAKRKFRVRALTRSAQERLDELEIEDVELQESMIRGLDLPDGVDMPSDQQIRDGIEFRRRQAAARGRAVEIACEKIDALTHPLEADDVVFEAGSFLLDQWQGDQVNESEIARVLSVVEAAAQQIPR
jgi:hypothetical protein